MIGERSGAFRAIPDIRETGPITGRPAFPPSVARRYHGIAINVGAVAPIHDRRAQRRISRHTRFSRDRPDHGTSGISAERGSALPRHREQHRGGSADP